MAQSFGRKSPPQKPKNSIIVAHAIKNILFVFYKKNPSKVFFFPSNSWSLHTTGVDSTYNLLVDWLMNCDFFIFIYFSIYLFKSSKFLSSVLELLTYFLDGYFFFSLSIFHNIQFLSLHCNQLELKNRHPRVGQLNSSRLRTQI